jgi:5-oxoprolinase (ATP-hydrolysing)
MPRPIIPLELTVDAPERTGIDGGVIKPLDSVAFRKNLQRLENEHVEVISVSLINSFANDAHEKEVAGILRQQFPAAEIVLSSDVFPEVGEYERAVTAAVNALVKPTVKNYLGHLTTLLQDDTDTIRVLKSDGGLTSIGIAEELPVNLLM